MFGNNGNIPDFGLYHALNNRIPFIMGGFGICNKLVGDSLDGRIVYYRNIPRKWLVLR